MIVNNINITTPITTGKTINFLLEMDFDFNGRTDSIELYEHDVIKDYVGVPNDYEISRYSHAPYGNNNLTQLNYDFYFYSGNPLNVTASSINNWVCSYIPEGFTSIEIYYFSKPFTNSFFKLDFYDSNNTETQRNYFTIIIPTQQGLTDTASISTLLSNIKIKKPSFILDFIGDKEGFFIYWLQEPQFLNIDTFYVSAKFFDAKQGVFVRMLNTPQSNIGNTFIFNNSDYYYYKVILNYSDKTYMIYDNQDNRIGNGTPINWYEYINP